MKKNLMLILLMFISSMNLLAQFTANDVFNPKTPITWLGVDFSEVRFIGPATGWGEVSTKSPTEMRDKYFPEWNSLIINEFEKFKIEDAVARLELDKNIDAVSKANEKTNKKELFSENISDYQSLDEETIKSMLKKYDFSGKDGLGFLLVAEGMSKGREEASYWATFVDMRTKKVLFTKRITGKALGFGFRNYWAGSMKNVFKTMKKEFKNWD
jgi:hypothetical protein